MPSPALSDPRREREANDEIPARGRRRCPVCHAPLPHDRALMGEGRPGPKPKYCGDRCRLFAWRRDGDPDGQLNRMKSDKR